MTTNPLTRRLVLVAFVAAGASACHSDPIVVDTPAPAGAYGKPLVELASGLAVDNELVVRFGAGADDQAVRDIAARHGAEVVWRGPRTGLTVLRFRTGGAREVAVSALTAEVDVVECLPQRVARGTGIGTSPDVLRAVQWNLRALSVDPDVPPTPISGVRIAILDTGVAYETHQDALGSYELAPALSGVTFAAGYDFVNGDAHANDDQGHGTHVAGIIAASAGITPLAAGAEIIPVKVLDAGNLGTELSLAEGIYFAVDAGADVINMSLAFSPAYFPSSYLQRAIAYAADSGVVMVAAVGNHGSNVVTYPAAFRDVLAVGASRMKRSARLWHRDLYDRVDDGDGDNDAGGVFGDPRAQRRLTSARYSNRGALVDVTAPGGDIDRDADGDGQPDGIVAMTFVGDPTDFDYFFFAGTSQAAAEVSAIAARMLHANPQLTPDQVRAVLGDTAVGNGRRLLQTDVGRGHVVAPDALAVAADDASLAPRPRFYASVAVTLHHRRGDRRYARAHVEIVDEQGEPVRNIRVYGSFTGAAYATRSGRTKRDGTVVFTSPRLVTDDAVVAFQVEAVVFTHAGERVMDRPRGFYRIDSCSLASLVDFAGAAGIGTSPGPIPPRPILANPITMVMPQVASRQIETLGLVNFSWGLTTVPMSVAVDASWFVQEFPGAAMLRVVVGGDGVGTSPIVIDPETAFSTPMPATTDDCIDLQVRTFNGAGIGTSPIINVPNGGSCGGQCQRYRAVLDELWTAYATGIGTSPVWDGSIPRSQFDHLSATMRGFVGFGAHSDAAPVGTYGSALDAAGIGIAPIRPSGGASGYGAEPMAP